MNCIDLYSGIGGWTLGMKLAGIKHHSSFEWSPDSNKTHNLNFGTHNDEVDIRKLKLSSLPKPGSIDIVVGSPPCTQFSFANRGGNGNIEDGLVDLHKFFSVIQYLKPKYWAMENVPRVRNIVNDLVDLHPDFKQFKELITFNEVVNSWEYGTPQKRKRMICGNFPFERFLSYRARCPRYSLDDALAQLGSKGRVDKLYGWAKGEITDNEKELPLSKEEVRINREAKLYHPVYNKMSFPDPREQPARTVTSLCTRVSRESIVIEDDGILRRLTLRERGVLMGFPVSYQFYAKSYSSKLKMIGNAIPPPLTYHLFIAMKQETHAPLRSQKNYRHVIPDEPAHVTPPPVPRKLFKPNRTFRMCVTGYRFGSGVRFELSNRYSNWRVRFFYGSSKSISELLLDENLRSNLEHRLPKKVFVRLPKMLKNLSSDKLQAAWVGGDGTHPFEATDMLGVLGGEIEALLPEEERIQLILGEVLRGKVNQSLLKNPSKTLAGIILGVAFNENIKDVDQNANRA
jgi:DNA (cytosine-5)-methyltransferase 1